MTHTWKIGDWCETKVKNRALVVEVQGNAIRVCMKHEIVGTPWIDSAVLKPLPHCDSWDWQPPSPPDPGEGYRAIDPAVDVPEEGDEIWVDDRWLPRPFDMACLSFWKDLHYRRKLPPTYAPFTAETFKPHRDRWIRGKGAGAFRIDDYDDEGYVVRSCTYSWAFLRAHYTFDDDGSPCGVPQ